MPAAVSAGPLRRKRAAAAARWVMGSAGAAEAVPRGEQRHPRACSWGRAPCRHAMHCTCRSQFSLPNAEILRCASAAGSTSSSPPKPKSAVAWGTSMATRASARHALAAIAGAADKCRGRGKSAETSLWRPRDLPALCAWTRCWRQLIACREARHKWQTHSALATSAGTQQTRRRIGGKCGRCLASVWQRVLLLASKSSTRPTLSHCPECAGKAALCSAQRPAGCSTSSAELDAHPLDRGAATSSDWPTCYAHAAHVTGPGSHAVTDW